MATEDEIRYQFLSAIRERVVSDILHTRSRMLSAMASQGLNVDLAQISHLVVFHKARDGVQGFRVTPVPWYKGQAWPTETEYHQRARILAGFGGAYRDEVLFDFSAMIEQEVGSVTDPGD